MIIRFPSCLIRYRKWLTKPFRSHGRPSKKSEQKKGAWSSAIHLSAQIYRLHKGNPPVILSSVKVTFLVMPPDRSFFNLTAESAGSACSDTPGLFCYTLYRQTEENKQESDAFIYRKGLCAKSELPLFIWGLSDAEKQLTDMQLFFQRNLSSLRVQEHI